MFFDSVHACSTSYFSRLYLLLYVLFIFKMLSTVSISAAWDLLWPGVITFRKSMYIFAVVVRACVCVSSVWLFTVRVCRQGYLSSRLSPSQSWTYAARGWVRARGVERGEFVNADVAVTSQKSWTNGGRSAPFRECVEKTYTYTYIFTVPVGYTLQSKFAETGLLIGNYLDSCAVGRENFWRKRLRI